MEIKGRIIHVLPLQSGVGQVSGKEWKKQEYVLETQEQQRYPRKVCFQLSGSRIDQYPLSVGDEVVVSFDLESREGRGRWYTDVRAWRIEKLSSSEAAAAAPSEAPTAEPEPEGQSDDLPF
ncbi:MAG: DUF3127 domain-containing protein [Porphyromonadaceae bacterium]|nr:DUF3127 domain-containing protein [Porphyromonadaceae bacterium]